MNRIIRFFESGSISGMFNDKEFEGDKKLKYLNHLNIESQSHILENFWIVILDNTPMLKISLLLNNL